MNCKFTLLYIVALWSIQPTHAQTYLRNDGKTIKIPSTHKLRVNNGHIVNNGTINNAGTVRLTGDYTETALGSYTGTATSWLDFAGTALQSIQSANALTIQRLKVQNGNNLRLQSNLTITQTLDLAFSGNIELGNFNLTCLNANITGYDATHYIITSDAGVLIQQLAAGDIKEYPVGKAYYNPVVLLANSGATDNFSVRVSDQLFANGSSGAVATADNVGATWHISESVAGGNNVDMSVEWASAQELSGFTRANSTIKHWGGSAWDYGTYGAATASGSRWSQTRASITSFSPFGVTSQVNNTFPIELMDFVAKREDAATVRLDWATYTETNNARFEVERMLDNELSFSKIGEVAGHGTTTEIHRYKWLDNNAYTNTSYYRLKQIDTDGKYSYSPIVALMGADASASVNLFPNPANEVLHVRMNVAEATSAHISIVDTKGATVWAQKQTIQPNQPLVLDAVATLLPNTYVVKIQLATGNVVQRTFVKI